MSTGTKKKRTLLNSNPNSNDLDYDDGVDSQNNDEEKTVISDLIAKYNDSYSEEGNTNIISAAQSIPNFKYLYIVQLIDPFDSSNRINVVGVKQESMTQQDAVASEIKRLLHLTKPSTLIVQLSRERYEMQMNEQMEFEQEIPITYSLSSLLSQNHLAQSTRTALRLINTITTDYKVRMNPYLFALLFANNDENGCDFVDDIILGDTAMPHQHGQKVYFHFVFLCVFEESLKMLKMLKFFEVFK